MKHVSLGALEVSRLGLGAMGMSAFYTGAGINDAESIRTIRRGLELGITFIDTAEIYGPYTNEQLVGRAIIGRRDEVVLATKFGMIPTATVAAGKSTAPPRISGLQSRARLSGWAPITSTCIISIASTLRRQLRTPWAR
jgi:aryl-alcohol dehydrogenase-like predicted oxidoreductase